MTNERPEAGVAKPFDIMPTALDKKPRKIAPEYGSINPSSLPVVEFRPETVAATNRSPFHVTPFRRAGGYVVTVNEGFIVSIDTSTNQPIITYTPVTDLDNVPPKEFSVTAGDSIYLKVLTDSRGLCTGAEVLVSASELDSTHYVPLIDGEADGPTDGTFYYKLAEFDLDGSSLIVTPYHEGGNIETHNVLWEGTNTGFGKKLLRKFDVDTGRYRIKTVQNSTAGGENLILDVDDADEVFWATLKQKDDDPQVKVTTEGSGDATFIRIKGNGAEGETSFRNCNGAEMWKIIWKDGLIDPVTSSATLTLGDCETQSEGP